MKLTAQGGRPLNKLRNQFEMLICSEQGIRCGVRVRISLLPQAFLTRLYCTARDNTHNKARSIWQPHREFRILYGIIQHFEDWPNRKPRCCFYIGGWPMRCTVKRREHPVLEACATTKPLAIPKGKVEVPFMSVHHQSKQSVRARYDPKVCSGSMEVAYAQM